MTLIVLVVVHNLLLGIACLWTARKLWLLRRSLLRWSVNLLRAEKAIHRVLYQSPAAIEAVQMTTVQLRQHYEQLGVQYDQVQQMIRVLSIVRLIWPYRRFFMAIAKPVAPVPTNRSANHGPE